MQAWYSRFGLKLPNLDTEPDDHIGLELSFVAHLAELGLEAIQGQDQERFREALEAQRRFLAGHVLNWGPEWCSRVVETSGSEFYRGLALFTRGALSEAITRLVQTDPGGVRSTTAARLDYPRITHAKLG